MLLSDTNCPFKPVSIMLKNEKQVTEAVIGLSVNESILEVTVFLGHTLIFMSRWRPAKRFGCSWSGSHPQ